MRAIRRRSILGVVAVAAIAFTAACGGGDSDGDDSSDDGQTVDEFIAAADEICSSFDARFNDVPEPETPDEFEPFLQTAVDLQGEQLTELQALDPPDEVATPWNEAIGVLTVARSQTEDALQELQGGADPAEVATSIGEELTESDDRLDELAAEIGLMECGDDEDSSGSTTEPEPDDTTTDGTLTDSEPTTTSDEPPTTDGPSTQGDVSTYLSDVGEASQALISFGQILQGVTSPDDLQAQVPQAQAALDEFDAAIAELDGYTLEDPQLEEQRSGLVETGPNVSDVLRRFTDAAAAGDLAAASMLIPEVTSALSEFQAAATVGNP